MKFAPRISPRLLAAIDRLAERDLSAAEISRLVGAEAERLNLTRPSYQRVRALVQESRSRRRLSTTDERLTSIAYPFHPPTPLWANPKSGRRQYG